MIINDFMSKKKEKKVLTELTFYFEIKCILTFDGFRKHFFLYISN